MAALIAQEAPSNDGQVMLLVDELKKLSEEDRLEVFSHFCRFCGSDDPRCQCWNDE